MLLIIEALLLISAALGQDHKAAEAAAEVPLNMALDSVDDQYDGCGQDMANQVEKEYLKKELKNSDFNSAWEEGERSYKKREDNLNKTHSIAIYVYTSSKVYIAFNNDTRSGKKKYTDKTYKWYSLHFLLTDAIKILRKTQNGCYKTYRGTNVKFNNNKNDVLNKEVRFGSFASSSLYLNRTNFFGKVSCFEIHTCEGANVTKYSKLSHEQEVLIPPYEKFKVTDIKTRLDQKDLRCDTVFTLKSTGRKSYLNCVLFKKDKKSIINDYVVH